jgi:DNA-binding transcriptional LysR family regulator
VLGTRLTDEGTLVVSAVERMEAASFDLLPARNSVTQTLSGEVRVAVTEGPGTFWLALASLNFSRPSRTFSSTFTAPCTPPTY